MASVLRSGWITSGEVGLEFEDSLKRFTGAGGVSLLNSCTAALELALRVLGIGPGDEVIVPAYTYTASAAVVAHVGARIVLVDTAPGQYVPAIDSILRLVSERTKAIIVVDLAGVPFDTGALKSALFQSQAASGNDVVERFGRPAVIVDGAHSLGAIRDGMNAGQMGDFTAFSFHAVKNLTTAEGGALTWREDVPLDQEDTSREIRRLSLHGQSKDAFSKMKAGAWEYDIVELGYKCNMPDALAALGLSQLARYRHSICKRHELARMYGERLGSDLVTLAHSDGHMSSSAHLYMVDLGTRADERDQLISRMATSGISTNVHYKPLPLLTAYRNLGFSIADFPNSYRQYRGELTLPLHTLLTEQDVDTVASALLSHLGEL